MEKINIFKTAKYGDRFICYNGTIAFFAGILEDKECLDGQGKYVLLTDDPMNGFKVRVHSDGRIFPFITGIHVDERCNARNYFDIISKYNEKITSKEDLHLLQMNSGYLNSGYFKRRNKNQIK